MTVAAIKPPHHRLEEAAEECLEAAKNDRSSALAMLERALNEDADLRRDIAEEAIRLGLKKALHDAIHKTRARHWRAANHRATAASNDRLVSSLTLSPYGYPLSCGVDLGDATREQVESEMQMHADQERANGERRRWYGMILDRMPNNSRAKVRKHLTEEEIQELMQAVRAA